MNIVNNEDYWKQFMASGRVEDYLSYACHTADNEAAPKEEAGLSGREKYGEYPYAGFYYGDRDGDKPDSCW